MSSLHSMCQSTISMVRDDRLNKGNGGVAKNGWWSERREKKNQGWGEIDIFQNWKYLDINKVVSF